MVFLTHCGILIIRIIAIMPASIRMTVAYFLGTLAYLISARHRHIGRINLLLCFPRMKKKTREILIYKVFCQLCIGVCETAYAWCGNIRSTPPDIIWEGRQEFEKVFRQGKPVILISGHFSLLDPGLIAFSHFFPLAATYKVHRNKIFNDFLIRCRLRHVKQLFSSRQTFSIRKAFQQGHIVWLSIDQDIGRKHSHYTSFFSTQAASHTAAWKWSKIAKAEVFLFHCLLIRRQVYSISLFHLKKFAQLPAKQAIRYQNQVLCRAIEQAPAQYLWLHKRLKTQPDGRNVYARSKLAANL